MLRILGERNSCGIQKKCFWLWQMGAFWQHAVGIPKLKAPKLPREIATCYNSCFLISRRWTSLCKDHDNMDHLLCPVMILVTIKINLDKKGPFKMRPTRHFNWEKFPRPWNPIFTPKNFIIKFILLSHDSLKVSFSRLEFQPLNVGCVFDDWPAQHSPRWL